MQATRAKRALIPGMLALAVVVLSACGKKNEAPAAQTPEVKVVTLKNEAVTLDTSLPGRTLAYRIAEVRPQVNGIIQKRLFVEGSDVKQGQQLYQIDPSTYEATAKSAEANPKLEPIAKLEPPKVDPAKLNNPQVTDLMTKAGLL